MPDEHTLYGASLPWGVKVVLVAPAPLVLLVSVPVVYTLSRDMTLAVAGGGLASVFTLAQSLIIFRYVLAPRTLGLRITSRRIHLPGHAARRTGMESIPLAGVKDVHISGRYVALLLKDGKTVLLLCFEPERVRTLILNARRNAAGGRHSPPDA